MTDPLPEDRRPDDIRLTVRLTPELVARLPEGKTLSERVRFALALGAAAFLFLSTDERFRGLEDDISDARRDAVADGRAMEGRLNDEVRRTVEEIGQARTSLAELRARLDESSRSQGDAVATLRE